MSDEEQYRFKKKWLDAYHKKPVIYITIIEKNVCKFGYTNNIMERIKQHKSQIHSDFMPEYIIETIYNLQVEKDIKEKLADRIFSKIYNGKNQTELIRLDEEFTIHDLHDLINELKNNYTDKEMIIKLTSEIEQLNLIKPIKEVKNPKDFLRFHLKYNSKDTSKKEIKEKDGYIFKCSGCEYTSPKKENVTRHMNNKNPCSQENRTIIEILVEIKCKHCEKFFSSQKTLSYHQKNNCDEIRLFNLCKKYESYVEK
jgi:predicted GIY-YIG superfamily endonuclease